jgi:hypothetical protein
LLPLPFSVVLYVAFQAESACPARYSAARLQVAAAKTSTQQHTLSGRGPVKPYFWPGPIAAILVKPTAIFKPRVEVIRNPRVSDYLNPQLGRVIPSIGVFYMRNLLALAALALLAFGGAGWYLGWYKIQTTPTADGHQKIQIDLNTDKIKTDVAKGENKVHALITETQGSNPQTPNGTATSFQPAPDGSFVFPASGSTPASGTSTLPPPR